MVVPFPQADNMGPFYAASTTPEVNIGLIGEVSAAVVATIILVAVTIVFIKRYVIGDLFQLLYSVIFSCINLYLKLKLKIPKADTVFLIYFEHV